MRDLIRDFKKLEDSVISRFNKGEINSILLNRYINILNKLDKGDIVEDKKIIKIMLLVNN